MTGTERHALSERIATLAEAAGLPAELLWEPAETCPQGHENYHEVYIHGGASTHWEENAPWHPGELCQACIIDATPRLRHLDLEDAYPFAKELAKEHRDDPTFHPEWRIGRVAKDLTDPAYLLPVVEAWRQLRPLRSWRMTSRLDAEIKCNAYAGVSEVPDGFIKIETLRNGSTPWEALAQAFTEALEKGAQP